MENKGDMAKLQFEFELAADTDKKSNDIIIKTITDIDGKKFLMQQCYQSYKQHPELSKLNEFKRVKKSLEKRGQGRNVWITLDDEILKLYKDESGNMIYNDFLLEDVTNIEQSTKNIPATQIDENLMKFLEKLCKKEPTQKNKNKNWNELCGKFVLDKFEGKKMNANQWLQIYESECNRLDIKNDVEKIEILRLFLYDTIKDWFHSILIRHSLNSEWTTWKNNFLQTFADRGWSSVTYALNYKYLTGLILEYVEKKEHLLLEINKNMDNRTLVDLIADGLPTFVKNKIDRQETNNSVDLFSELRKYENISGKNLKKNK